jgi:hypothetical protein
MLIIVALPLEYSVDHAGQLIRDLRERDQIMVASLALALIDGPAHRVEATGGERGVPDGSAQGGRAPFAHLRLAGRLPGLMPLRGHADPSHQLIRVGAAPDLPAFTINCRGCRTAETGNSEQLLVQGGRPRLRRL